MNCYKKGHSGSIGQASNVSSNDTSAYAYPGYFIKVGNGATAKLQRTEDPARIYYLGADIIPLAVPVARFLYRKIHKHKENLHSNSYDSRFNDLYKVWADTYQEKNDNIRQLKSLSPTNTELQKYIIQFPDTQTEQQDDTSRRCGSR